MSDKASGHDIADDLGALARASSPAPGTPGSAPQAAQPAHDDDDDYITAEVEDESGADPASAPMHFHAAPGNPGSHAAPRPLPVRSRKKNSELKAIAAPVLLTVGVLLLIPASWGLLVLAGAPVPMAEREDASSMAKVMLLCWPLALSLLLPALIIFGQLHAEKKRAAQVRSL